MFGSNTNTSGHHVLVITQCLNVYNFDFSKITPYEFDPIRRENIWSTWVMRLQMFEIWKTPVVSTFSYPTSFAHACTVGGVLITM